MHGCPEPDKRGGRKRRGEGSRTLGETEGPGLGAGEPSAAAERRVKSAGCQGWGALGVCSMQLLRAINTADQYCAGSVFTSSLDTIKGSIIGIKGNLCKRSASMLQGQITPGGASLGPRAKTLHRHSLLHSGIE